MHAWQMEKPHRQFQQKVNSFLQQSQILILLLRLLFFRLLCVFTKFYTSFMYGKGLYL